MNNAPVAFISEFIRARLRSDSPPKWVDALPQQDGLYCVPLYLKVPDFDITDDQAERILALVKGEQWRNKLGTGGVGMGKALKNALDEILSR